MLKNKLVALATAFAVVAAPVSALAVVSPDTVVTNTDPATGVEVTVKCNKVNEDDWIAVEPGDSAKDIASNVPAEQMKNVVATFVVTHQGTQPPYTFSYTLGSEYAYSTVTVYIEHEDGTTEEVPVTADANGAITFTQNKLSTHTIVSVKANASTNTASSNSSSSKSSTSTGRDTSSRSPQTGVDTTAVAGVSAAALAAAGVVAVSLRKKVNE